METTTKVKSIKKLSGNELGESINLMSEITFLIETEYCHVKDNLPVNLRKSISDYLEKLRKELDRREEILNS